MATALTLRQNKGSPLTFKEGDDNFLYLDGKIDAVSATTKIYDTKAAGLAATKDSDTFWVIGSGDVAAKLYRRVNSATATELASSLSTQFKADLADPTKGAKLIGFALDAEGAEAATQAGINAETISIARFMGGIGDGGTTDPFEAFKNAIAYLKARGGGGLYIPPGHYKTIQRPSSDPASWIEIDSSGISLWANPGSVTLENFLFYVHGEYGTPQLIGSTPINSGDTTITTANPHGLFAGDRIQMLSQLNPYTPDAGDWQMGSKNPTSLVIPTCRFSEMKTVRQVSSDWEFSVIEPVLYGGYKDNTVGQNFPIAGVTGAEIRKITPVTGIIFRGIKFKNTEVNSFRGLLFRAVSNAVFIDCGFEAGTRPGAHFACSDSSNIGFVRCESYRKPEGSSGSGWNSFIVGGGSEMIYFERCKMYGESQSIDFTPNTRTSDPGATNDATKADYLTAQYLFVDDSLFHGCSDAVTSHPATYAVSITNTSAFGGNTGFRIRSRASKVLGCTTVTNRGGVALSAYHDDTEIANCTFIESGTGDIWHGISVAPLSSEIMNSNSTRNVRIHDNLLIDKSGNVNSAGVAFLMYGNGVPPNPEFDLLTNSVKTNLSGYEVVDNHFSGCSFYVRRWINGITCKRNTFKDGSGKSHYILVEDGAARHWIDGNIFQDNIVPAALIGKPDSGLSYPYPPEHKIGSFIGENHAPVVSTESTSGAFVYSGNTILDKLTLGNGGKLAAYRTSGAATTRIDAIVGDGVSDASIRLFDNNPTTGNRTLSVTGRIESQNAYPIAANTYTSGIPTRAWAGGFTQTAFTVTSDKREKQQVKPIDSAAIRAWAKVEYCMYKLNDAVEQKGDAARWHIGLIAQQVKEAFESEGLDAFEYGLLCYDQWDEQPEIVDDDGIIIQHYRPAGNRYGIRYEEALALECAYLRSRLN